MSDYDPRVPLWRIPDCHWLVVYIGVVDCAIAIDGDGRISTLLLRKSVRYLELDPGCTTVGAEYAPLQTAALVDW